MTTIDVSKEIYHVLMEFVDFCDLQLAKIWGTMPSFRQTGITDNKKVIIKKNTSEKKML